MTDNNKFKFSPDTDSIKGDTFSSMYPVLNRHMLLKAENNDSRNGRTKEIMSFKTSITNPYRRCVGGFERDVNIFFLMAEAIWIFTGKRDVEYLTQFNSRMSDYSDNGKYFHSPYGWRLRNYGANSEMEYESSNIHTSQGLDQVYEALQMLSKDSNSRRVVMEIWDAEYDLNVNSKDLPCNDLVFLKLRGGKLFTTISNRSNDLHWGLTTNLYQFSFLSEMISLILGVELGQQTHNSDSLHIYLDNQTAWTMFENVEMNTNNVDLYEVSEAVKIDFNFEEFYDNTGEKLNDIDSTLNYIIKCTSHIVGDDAKAFLIPKRIEKKSIYLSLVMMLLQIYLLYKNSKKEDVNRTEAIDRILSVLCFEKYESLRKADFIVLSLNFFMKRIKSKELFDKYYTLIGIKNLGKF
jgi:thymidylate synthase